MLLRIALEVGVEIEYGTRVSQVIPGEELPREISPHSDPVTPASVTGHGPPSVRLANGEILTADIIIGADGSRSMVRELLLDPEHDHGVESGYTVYS
jgi:salicylate hydroxylase